MASKDTPGGASQPGLQGMIDEMRSRARKQKPDIWGVCPSCKRTIQMDGSGHAPQCNHDEPPHDPAGD